MGGCRHGIFGEELLLSHISEIIGEQVVDLFDCGVGVASFIHWFSTALTSADVMFPTTLLPMTG
jgi:hypothetical protein